MGRRSRAAVERTLLGLVALTVAASTARAQHPGHGATPPAAAATQGAAAPRKVTMEELHRQGGVPRGWKFTLPPGGDPARGREVFASLECYKCHAMKGESFPAVAADAKNVGPDLAGMGAHHPAEYFAESIINPNAVIVTGPGFTGPDGKSVMPSFADTLTVTQWLDLVAYLKSSGGGEHAHHHAGAARESVAGPYRVRLVYAMKSQGHDHAAPQGHAGHDHHAMGAGGGSGHLMAFVTDRDSDEPLPYLPVTATIQITGRPNRTVRLGPMISPRGFHYGADVVLPDDTQRITLLIGATNVTVMGPAADRYKTPTRVVFDWQAAAK